MKLMFMFGAFLFYSIQCHDSGSAESSYNGIELSPFYDTIIFSDIADIMKEFESSNMAFFDKLAKEGSESDENIEDLLQEYQKHLEKEQQQRKDYMERTKLKNKVPLLHHERFSKTSFGNGGKYNDYLYKKGYYNLDKYKSKDPFDLFIPINQKVNYFNTMKPLTTLPRDSMELNNFKKILLNEDSFMPLSFPNFPVKAPCCKNGQMSCKQCMTAKDHSRSRLEPRASIYSKEKKTDAEYKFADLPDPNDALNIRIKVDVQLPKLHEGFDKYQNTFDFDDGSNTKDFPLAIKMPTSYYDYPIPMNLFGFKRISKLSASPLHKLTIRKKKKSKASTGGKKHRKKIITFQDIKLEPQQIYETHFGNTTVSEISPNDNHSTVTPDLASSTTEIVETNYSSTTTALLEKVNSNETQAEENIFIVVNISNNVVNETEESNKTTNSIETEYTNLISNVTTEKPLHSIKKRESTTKTVIVANKTVTFRNKTITLNRTLREDKHVFNITKAIKDSAKKIDKSLPSEEELLHWPNKNGSQSKVASMNITTIILDRETHRAKLNMTKDTMPKNHTRALEKVIFGDIDWNDVSAVAPAFVSFIGKYIEGTLTFCSDVICHSMKCGQKVCHYRVCKPIERFNNKGHCMGDNNTDSVATMESILDLPSNIAFEIVDIIQDKITGKLFGKVTLCISSKCITLATSKKMFIKYKCIVKDLNSKGHCVNTKERKVA